MAFHGNGQSTEAPEPGIMNTENIRDDGLQRGKPAPKPLTGWSHFGPRVTEKSAIRTPITGDTGRTEKATLASKRMAGRRVICSTTSANDHRLIPAEPLPAIPTARRFQGKACTPRGQKHAPWPHIPAGIRRMVMPGNSR